MKQAVISFGGHQYIVSPGDVILVQRKGLQKGERVVFDKVISILTEDQTKVGKPYLRNVVVEGEVLERKKGKKIRVARFRAKSRYRKVRGFRPVFCEIKINKIKVKGEKENGKD